jgi:dipeptidyl aminopeptidase/acylaminoacyl peptidase
MRKSLLILSFVLVVMYASRFSGSAQTPAPTPGYLTPPKVISDIMDAEPLPAVTLSPDRKLMLLSYRRSMPGIVEVATPFFGLAGYRINPRNNGMRALNGPTKLTLKDLATGTERELALPPGGTYTASFSPDGTKIGITITTPGNIQLYVADVGMAQAKPILTSGINGISGGCSWLDDSSGFLCRLIPAGRGPEPRTPAVPAGPSIQDNAGHAAPSATYEDLLKNPYDESLYEYYFTSQLAWVDLAGKKTLFGKPAIYGGADVSTDGNWLVVTRIKRPYSYVVPAGNFPRDVELWDKAGKTVRKLADVPMGDTFPRNGVFPGPRSIRWHPMEPATLIYTEALDKGDPANKVPFRDRFLALSAPFTGQPAELVQTQWRAGFVQFTESGAILVSESDRETRMRRTWLYPSGFKSSPTKVWELRQQDRYADPGSPMLRPATGKIIQSGDTIYLTGAGASPKGDRPFIDRLNLKTLKPERIWQCDDTSSETVVALLDDNASQIVTRHETRIEAPNYFIRHTTEQTMRPVTGFKDPQPQISAVSRQFVTYKRKDGVDLNGTIYLPMDYKQGTRYPMYIWAYPAEFTSSDMAGQVSGNPNRFTTVSGASHLLLLTQGYVVFDNPTMPIIGPGETANDTYVEQLVASAEAAIDKAVDMGVADRDRIGVGGHSYGAFMTANLLAHSRLFRAGTARSGAYNRTLTPFGFQSETRNFWEVPQVYSKMSPFFYANEVKDPILLIHGEMDDNSGTFPIQSERFYMALKGFGATVRYVTLPCEAHGYAAAESNKHVITEMLNWLDRYVKNAGPRQTTGR